MNIRKLITLLATIVALAGTPAQAIGWLEYYQCKRAFDKAWEARKNNGLNDMASAAFYVAIETIDPAKFQKCIQDSKKHEPKCYAYAGNLMKAAVIVQGGTINDSPARDAVFKAATETADTILAGHIRV